MGYWLLKRGIPEVALLSTLRDRGGRVLDRSSITARTSKSVNGSKIISSFRRRTRVSSSGRVARIPVPAECERASRETVSRARKLQLCL